MSNIQYKIINSTFTDPRINLAFEEYFMNTVKEDELIIFFWQSENAVVIGRNQNPYQECNISQLDNDNVKLVRRLSGGGAVYHDLGNLNFSFIAQSDNFSIENNFHIILSALYKLNIIGEFNGRNDLTCNGRKFSGNAFIHNENRHLHHGTLLINADINKISNYLTVSHKKLENKGFNSVKSRVINLCELNENISVKLIISAVINYLSKIDSSTLKVIKTDQYSLKNIKEYIDKYMNHQWNYGDCPSFNTQFEEKFTWGLVSTSLTIEHGKIKNIQLHTDAIDAKSFKNFNNSLLNADLSLNTLRTLINNSKFQPLIKEDLLSYFQNHIFQ